MTALASLPSIVRPEGPFSLWNMLVSPGNPEAWVKSQFTGFREVGQHLNPAMPLRSGETLTSYCSGSHFSSVENACHNSFNDC